MKASCITSNFWIRTLDHGASRSHLYDNHVFKYVPVDEQRDGATVKRFYQCMDCQKGTALSTLMLKKTHATKVLVTTAPLVTVLTINDVVVQRDPDAPLGKQLITSSCIFQHADDMYA